MLKALHELLMTLYTKARLTASRTLFSASLSRVH